MTAARQPLISTTYVCSGAIPARTCVKLSDANTIVPATAVTDKVIGINGPVAGIDTGVAQITQLGFEEAIAGGTIVVGDLLVATTSGKVIAATAAATSLVNYVGQALSAGATGGTVLVNVAPGRWTVNTI